MADPGNGSDAGTRLILYAGKGGVGKTTVAAATAVRAAELGHRTLVVSTDIAHSLGDVLDTRLEAEPRQVAERLYAQEINPLEEVRRTWGKVQDQLSDLLREEGVSQVQAEELALLPGMEDISALVQIERKTKSGLYDCVVVDAAPTGETVRLLSMPESFQWYASRLQDWRARLSRFAGPLIRGALPDLNVVDSLGKLATRVKQLRKALTDPHRSSYRIVLTPDRMVLREALRAETYLNIFDYPIDAVLINRVMSEVEKGNSYLDALVARQEQIAGEIRAAFATLPVFGVDLTAEEPVGLPALARLAQHAFGELDPTGVLHVGPTQKVESSGDGYTLSIPMPNVELEKLSLMKQGDSLYVNVGTFRREIPLPWALAALEPGTARIRDGMLEIPFVASQQPAEPAPDET
jgi:arsenite/tail-anchored protein-transporting ATPase